MWVFLSFLHWSKILYEFLMSDMTIWGSQQMLWKPQKND